MEQQSVPGRYRALFRVAGWPHVHWILWPLVFGFLTTANALNVLQEARRNGLDFQSWEPFAWEYTSLLTSLIGVALVVWITTRTRGRPLAIKAGAIAVAITGFCAVHVGLMVPLRIGLYGLLGQSYEFGDWGRELPYELRKDVFTVALVITVCWALDLLRAIQSRSDAPKYARSALDEHSQVRIMERVAAAVREQQIHRDPNLTLTRLARAVGTPSNHLSQALNVQAGGFHQWVAQARIADAQALLRDQVEASGLLDAAFAVGFNSKSAFYDAFRRATGLTPGAWRDQNRGEGKNGPDERDVRGRASAQG